MAEDLAGLIRRMGEGAHVPEQDIRAVTAETDVAEALLDLSRRTAGLRQRSTELRAVMSSTRDLLSTTDAELLLHRIVDRAHELIELDIAYLSVYDASNEELYVRAATGTTSPRFLTMVVPAGIGLASLVARTRHPQWVEDYDALTSVPHDPVIDDILREEQLRSLVGVPLVVGDDVLGVLFGASRQPHSFRPEEISLLTTFAGHAALVLQTARLLQEATTATAQAAERQHAAEWAASLHGELTDLVVFGYGTDAVIGALGDALQRKVGLLDVAGKPVTGQLAGGEQRRSMRAHIERAVAGGKSIRLSSGAVELVAPVLAATGHLGAIVVERGRSPLTSVEQRAVERSAVIAALVTLRHDAVEQAEDRVRGELAVELFEPERRESGISRAAARGYAVAEPWVLFVAVLPPEQRAAALAGVRRRHEYLAAPVPTGIGVLAPLRCAGERGERIVAATGQPRVGGVYLHASSLEGAAKGVEEAVQSSKLALGLGLGSGIAPVSTLAPYALLFGGDGGRLREFVADTLAPVIAWDSANGSQLVETLAALFDTRWSLTAASRELHIHLNTLKQRVQRLRPLIGDAADNPEARFRLEIAVRVEVARRALKET